MPILPLELIDAIIDASAKNRETLHAFSVASRFCVPRCRKHIFKRIEFSTDYGEDVLAKRHEMFRFILASDPRVQFYVQEITIRDIEVSDGELPWMVTNTRFHETLYLLGPSVKRFNFVAETYDWDIFSPTLKLAFMSIFSSPSLKYINLQGLECVPRACCAAFAPQIVDLSIVRSSFVNKVDPDISTIAVPASCTPNNLYWLSLEDVDESSINVLLDTWIPAPLTKDRHQDQPLFPHLTALSVGPTDEGALSPIQKIIEGGRDSIQYFYWDYAHGSEAEPLSTTPLSLNNLRNLFAIKYEVTPPEEEFEAYPPPDHFAGLISLLQTVVPGAIQQIDLKIDFRTYDDLLKSLTEGYEGWQILNSLLLSETFGGLFHVSLLLEFEESGLREDSMIVDVNLQDRQAELGRLLRWRLPSLFKIESYNFTFSQRHLSCIDVFCAYYSRPNPSSPPRSYVLTRIKRV